MTLTFFYQVQDTGSWLEIGQSITFFCIASLLLWCAGICAGGEYLMADVISVRATSTWLRKTKEFFPIQRHQDSVADGLETSGFKARQSIQVAEG